jgi:hypothetical protein
MTCHQVATSVPEYVKVLQGVARCSASEYKVGSPRTPFNSNNKVGGGVATCDTTVLTGAA